MAENNYFLHPTAIVDAPTQIGDGTRIWHFTHISKDVFIGKNCVIGQNVFIGKNVRIGNGVKIQNNVSVFEGVEIEDDVFIGPSVVFTNVINPRAFIERKEEFKKTLIRKGASVGANTTIICGNTIGEYAMVGAGSVVTKSIENCELWFGNPALKKGMVDKEGNPLK